MAENLYLQQFHLYLQPLPGTRITVSAPPQIIRDWILIGAWVPGAEKVGDCWCLEFSLVKLVFSALFSSVILFN